MDFISRLDQFRKLIFTCVGLSIFRDRQADFHFVQECVPLDDSDDDSVSELMFGSLASSISSHKSSTLGYRKIPERSIVRKVLAKTTSYGHRVPETSATEGLLCPWRGG